MIANENSALRMLEVLADRRQRKRPPSQRDRDIAAAVRVQGRRQVEVAAEFGLSRRRVSQICRKIEQWHGSTASWERGEGDLEGYRQADRILHRDQLTEIYGAALRAYARSEEPLVTRRSGKRGEQRWSDRSQRQQRLDTGSLRVALKAIEMRWKLADRPFKEDEGKDEKARLRLVLGWVAEMLEFVRKDAETRGVVPKTPGGPKAAVERMLREFLGVPEESAEGKPREGEAPAEPAPQRDGATNSSMGSVWETPRETLPSAPAVAANEVAAPTCGAAAATGSALGSAPKIEMGNASSGTQTATTGRGYAEEEWRASPDPEPTTANKPTRLERLLASSRHLSRGHRRRLESLVAHRRGDARYAEGVTDQSPGSRAERAHPGINECASTEP